MTKRKCFRGGLLLAALSLSLSSPLLADEVIFNNGDKLTGKVLSADGATLKIKTNVAGEVTVDMKDVRTFSTDEPLQVRLKDKTILRDKISADPAATTQPGAGVVEVGGKPVPLAEVKKINDKQAWTGSLLLNGSLARGNTYASDLGFAANAVLRRDDEFHDDRFTLGAAYNYGSQKVNGVQSTSSDNWFALAKYDKFFTDKWYGFGLFRYDHDRLAFLNYRLAPGAGVGYQWVESPNFNFNTEAGLSYIWEDYTTSGQNEYLALRLAYHVDKKLNQTVSVFHNLAWLPAVDDVSNCTINADAGVRAQLTGAMFTEFKIVDQFVSQPAPGAEQNDLRFLLSVGWAF